MHHKKTCGSALGLLFAISEDTSVRNDWTADPSNPYSFKINRSRRAFRLERERSARRRNVALKLLSRSRTKGGPGDQHSALAGPVAPLPPLGRTGRPYRSWC